MNPLEFMSEFVKPFDGKLQEFMTNKKGLQAMRKAIDDVVGCPSERARIDEYVNEMEASFAKLLEANSASTSEKLVSEIARLTGSAVNQLEFSIAAILVIADDRGDLDSENYAIPMCEYRFNPFNRATNMCKPKGRPSEPVDKEVDDAAAKMASLRFAENETQHGVENVDFEKEPTGEAAQHAQLTKAIKMVGTTHESAVAAFSSMICVASQRWTKMVGGWDTNGKKDQHKEKTYRGNPLGVLFYDMYCTYFLCFVLDADDRRRLNDAFVSVGWELTDKVKAFARESDFFAMLEAEGTEAAQIRKVLNPSGAVIHESAKTTAFVSKNKDLGQLKFVLDDDTKAAIKQLPVLTNVTERVARVVDDDKQRKKVVAGINGFLQKASFYVAPHKGLTVTVGLVHGKEFDEPDGVHQLDVASLVNAAMGKADILLGDFNVAFKKSKIFFRSVHHLLGRDSADPAACQRAREYLEKRGVKPDDGSPWFRWTHTRPRRNAGSFLPNRLKYTSVSARSRTSFSTTAPRFDLSRARWFRTTRNTRMMFAAKSGQWTMPVSGQGLLCAEAEPLKLNVSRPVVVEWLRFWRVYVIWHRIPLWRHLVWVVCPRHSCSPLHPHDNDRCRHHDHVCDGKGNVQSGDDSVVHGGGASRRETMRAHTTAARAGGCLTCFFSISMKFRTVMGFVWSIGAATRGKSNASGASHLQRSMLRRCVRMCSRTSGVIRIPQ
jgi:hypothetical protein